MNQKLAELIGIPWFEADNTPCDICPARATHRIKFDTGILDFCTHHFNEHEPAFIHQSRGILNRDIQEGK